jgi:hypothetical protein
MRDIFRAVDRIANSLARGIDRRPASRRPKVQPSPAVWRSEKPTSNALKATGGTFMAKAPPGRSGGR